MAENDDPSTFDVDAIQAQIDLAMSMNEELVSTWVKPSVASGSKSGLAQKKKTFEETERELQTYMKRPPRLGVGAPIPESNGPGTREAMTLRNKLAGPGKRRGNKADSTNTSNVNGTVDDTSDVDEKEAKGVSRQSSTLKRARVDPFSLPRKKAKRLAQQTSGLKDTRGDSVETDLPVISAGTREPRLDNKLEGGSDSSSTAKSEAKPSLRSGTGSKQKLFSENFGGTSRVGINGVSTPPSMKSFPSEEDAAVDEEEWTGFSDPVPNEDKDTSTLKVNGALPDAKVHGVPLLNLNGPPPNGVSNEECDNRKSKKKKNRRRKKHKSRPV